MPADGGEKVREEPEVGTFGRGRRRRGPKREGPKEDKEEREGGNGVEAQEEEQSQTRDSKGVETRGERGVRRNQGQARGRQAGGRLGRRGGGAAAVARRCGCAQGRGDRQTGCVPVGPCPGRRAAGAGGAGAGGQLCGACGDSRADSDDALRRRPAGVSPDAFSAKSQQPRQSGQGLSGDRRWPAEQRARNGGPGG